MNKLIINTIIIFAVIFQFSCKDQYEFSTDNLSDDIPVNPELAIPLIDAQISVDELLSLSDTISFLEIDENNFMTLVYNFDVKQITAPDFFDGTYSGTLDDINYPLDPETLDLGIKKFPDYDEFYVANPRIIFTIKNYWDIPAVLSISQFDCIHGQPGTTISGTGTFFSNTYTVNKPVSPALSAITEIEVNTGNSNIDDLVSSIPDRIIVAGSLQTTPGVNYSVSSLSIDSVHLRVELPLDVRIKNLVLRDTIKFSAAKDLGSDTSKLDALRLNFVFDNGFPVNLTTQIYLADDEYNIIDSIFTNELSIPGGQISNGKVTQSTKTTPEPIIIEGTKRSSFYKASYMITKYKYNTVNNHLGQTVKVYSNYRIVFKAGALIKVKL
jgi:hypothetical protein